MVGWLDTNERLKEIRGCFVESLEDGGGYGKNDDGGRTTTRSISNIFVISLHCSHGECLITFDTQLCLQVIHK